MEGTQRSKFAITPWMIWLGLMGIILLSGLVAGIMVFWKGLGITNLTDMVPWGLWITIDLSSIALGAGAFSMCAAVYLFGLKRYDVVSPKALPQGKHTIKVEFTPENPKPGSPARVRLLVDDSPVAEGRVDEQVPQRCGTETMDIGMDTVGGRKRRAT